MRAGTQRRWRTQRRAALLPPAVLLASVLLGVTACGSDGPGAAGARAPAPADALSGSLVVSAAASLTDVFAEIGDAFVAAHPDVEVTVNVGSSGQLSAQIRDGAPADVAAFADVAPMDSLADAGLLAAEPTIFARNQLVVVTEPGNPEGIAGLADLSDVGVVSLCAETAPCGTFAAQALESAGVTIPTDRVTRGQDVRSTLTAVTQGDAAAGIVYLTDAVAAGDAVARVEIPAVDDVVAEYPIAVLADTGSTAVAEAFTEFVLSRAAQRLLSDAGFLAP